MKLGITLRTRLVLLVIAAVVPLFGLSIAGALLSAAETVSRTTQSLELSASLVAANQQRVAESARQVLTAIAHLNDLADGQGPQCSSQLKSINDQLTAYVNLGIIGPDGYLRCHALGDGLPRFFDDRPYFQEAMTKRTFVTGGYLRGRISKLPIMTFALPVQRQGRVTAVVFAAVQLSELSRVVASTPLPDGSRLVVMDRQGVVLAANPEASAPVGQPVRSPLLQAAIKADTAGVFEGVDAAGARQIYAFLPGAKAGESTFFVALSVDRSAVLAPVRQRLIVIVLLLALVAFLSSSIAWKIGGRTIMQPAADILSASEQIENGRLDVRVPVRGASSGSEFTRIALGFNRMADALEQRERQLADELARSVQAQAEQHESREHLKLLEVAISRLNEMVLITDAPSSGTVGPRIVYVNDAFERHTGYRREEVLGKSPSLLQGPQTQRSEIDRMRVAMTNWEPVRAELINYTKAGEAVWIEIDIVPMTDTAGRYTHWVAVERDITQRKLAEQALGESEQRYAALFDTGPVPMWVYDVDSLQFLTVNRETVKRYGYSAAEFLSMRILDIRTLAEAEALKTHLANDSFESRERWEHRRKDGSLFMVRAFSKPVQYGGKKARFVVALDISPQIKAESDVQAHLFSLQRAADATQAITRHQTVDGMLQEVAEQARGVIGAHQAVITLPLGGDWTQAVRASSLSKRYAALGDLIEPMDEAGLYAPVFEKNRAVRMTQAQIKTQVETQPSHDGLSSCPADHPALRGWLAVPLTGRSGQSIGLLQLADKYEGEFTLQDEYVATELAQLAAIALENARLLEQVSQLNMGLERKVAERTLALGRQEALFRALAEQAPQVVWTATPDGKVTYLNRAWFELAGGQWQDWAGARWFEAIHPEDLAAVHDQWDLARASQSSYGGIRRLLAKDGSYHTMSYRASPVLDDKGVVAFWVGIDADVSEIKAIEAALRLSNQELEAFSYSVSHDLRSPLNTIDGFSRLLSKQLTGDVGKKSQHYLSRIQVGVAQMGKLIEDLLSLAQVSRMQLRYEPVDLSALCLAIFQEWHTRHPERQVAIRVEDGLLVHGDSRLLRVVMENLLGNAWKFTSQKADSHIRVGKKIDVAGLPVFFVSDDGAGFDMAYADKLFTAFQRLHTAAEFPGTGIGLATVSRVISRHGGRLWAEAALGQGATFFFTAPNMPTATSNPNL